MKQNLDIVLAIRLSISSPSGKLVQIEYALQAVATGALSVGIRGAHLEHTMCPFELVHVPHVH